MNDLTLIIVLEIISWRYFRDLKKDQTKLKFVSDLYDKAKNLKKKTILMTSFSFLEINLRIIMYLTKCKTFIPCDSKIIKLYWVLWSDISSWYTITKCNCILFYSNCLWIFHEFLGFKNYQWWSENENLSHKGVSHVPFCPPSTVKGKKGQDKRGQDRHKILKMAKMIKISWKRNRKGQKGTNNTKKFGKKFGKL